MMPEDVFSTEVVHGRFTGARGLGVTKTIDYHEGGVGIQDVSQGLRYQRWRLRLLDAGLDESRAMLSAPNTPEFELYAVPGMTEVSLAFDQNMRPALAFVDPTGSYFRWFDTGVGAIVVAPVDGETPRIVLDDTRLVGSFGYQNNDIILAYKRAGVLYFRQQRDRFLIEYDPTAALPEQRALIAESGGLIKIGFNRQLRLQFQLEIPE